MYSNYTYENLQKHQENPTHSHFLSAVTSQNFFFFSFRISLNIYSDKIFGEALDSRPGSVSCCLWALGKAHGNNLSCLSISRCNQVWVSPLNPIKQWGWPSFPTPDLGFVLPISLLEASSQRTRKRGHFHSKNQLTCLPLKHMEVFLWRACLARWQLSLGALLNKWQ